MDSNSTVDSTPSQPTEDKPKSQNFDALRIVEVFGRLMKAHNLFVRYDEENGRYEVVMGSRGSHYGRGDSVLEAMNSAIETARGELERNKRAAEDFEKLLND